MPEAIIKKDGTDYPIQTMPLHYPADRVYLDGDTSKTVQDELEDSGWKTTSNGTGYRKIGHTVDVIINRKTDYTTGWSVFDTLPSGYRPSIVIYGSVVYESTNGNFSSQVLQINTSGELAIYSNGLTDKRIYGSITFLV